MKPDLDRRRTAKIAAALALSLLGLALLPILALPYDRLDWVAYDPAYQTGYGCPLPPEPPPPTPTPPLRETPQGVCAELPTAGEPLAATVNNQGIGSAALERETDQFLAALQASGVDVSSDESQVQMPAWRRQVLDLLIDDVLIQQAAVEAGIVISDDVVAMQVTAEISQSGGLESYASWLRQTGQTAAEFERDVCQDLLDQAVRDWVTAGVTGTDELVWARQIVLATEQDARVALDRIKSGRPFVVVAQEMSIDTQTRMHGGSLGWFAPGSGQVAPQIEAAAVRGAPGEVQGPIPIGDRFVIVQTLAHRPGRPITPESREQSRAQAFEDWLARRRAQAKIVVY